MIVAERSEQPRRARRCSAGAGARPQAGGRRRADRGDPAPRQAAAPASTRGPGGEVLAELGADRCEELRRTRRAPVAAAGARPRQPRDAAKSSSWRPTRSRSTAGNCWTKTGPRIPAPDLVRLLRSPPASSTPSAKATCWARRPEGDAGGDLGAATRPGGDVGLFAPKDSMRCPHPGEAGPAGRATGSKASPSSRTAMWILPPTSRH